MDDKCKFIELDEEILQGYTQGGQQTIKGILIECRNSGVITPPRYTELASPEKYINLLNELYTFQLSSDYEYRYKDRGRDADPLAGVISCQWPGCQVTESLEKDHLFPRSVLKGSRILASICFTKANLKPWDDFNSAWLCERHNRNVKNDSIGLGIWLIQKLER